MGKKYTDSRGWKYQVMAGIAMDTYKARYQKDEKHGGTGWHCIRTLPWRNTMDEAQADLDQLAEKKGWGTWSSE